MRFLNIKLTKIFIHSVVLQLKLNLDLLYLCSHICDNIFSVASDKWSHDVCLIRKQISLCCHELTYLRKFNTASNKIEFVEYFNSSFGECLLKEYCITYASVNLFLIEAIMWNTSDRHWESPEPVSFIRKRAQSIRKSFFDFARWNSANVAVSYLYFTLVMIDLGSGQSIFGKLINGYDVRYRRTKRRRVIYQLYILISGNHPCV